MMDSWDRVGEFRPRRGDSGDEAARELKSEDFFTHNQRAWELKKREVKAEGGKARGDEEKGLLLKEKKPEAAKDENEKKANITHRPFSVGSISGNSRKTVL